jgi:hypothetical protein
LKFTLKQKLTIMKKFLTCISLLILISTSCGKKDSPAPTPSPNGITAPPASLSLSSFYKKYVDADGIPVISSANVADEALLKAKDIIQYMLKNIPAEKTKMIANKLRVELLASMRSPHKCLNTATCIQHSPVQTGTTGQELMVLLFSGRSLLTVKKTCFASKV